MMYRWHVFLWCVPNHTKGWNGKNLGQWYAKLTRVRDGTEEGHWALWAVVHAEDYRNACTQLKLYSTWFGYCLYDLRVGTKVNCSPVFLDDRDPWDQQVTE
jgi:hypothetical protein